MLLFIMIHTYSSISVIVGTLLETIVSSRWMDVRSDIISFSDLFL